MANFKINKAEMKKLERNLQERFAEHIDVPAQGTEDDAVRSVKDQLKKMGATPNATEVRRIVREARNRLK